MSKANQPGVPRFIFVVIVAILGLMYSYAAFIDSPASEKTVNKFYKAYFSQDYDTVADNLSVFWAVRFLPQYENLSAAELIAKRDDVVKETAAFITSIEKDNPVPKNVKIKVLPEYTQEGTNSAIVVYGFVEDGKDSGMEAAILIREEGKYRIFNMTPVDPQSLQQLKEADISILDTNFKELLTSK